MSKPETVEPQNRGKSDSEGDAGASGAGPAGAQMPVAGRAASIRAAFVALLAATTFLCFYHLEGGAGFESIDCWVAQSARQDWRSQDPEPTTTGGLRIPSSVVEAAPPVPVRPASTRRGGRRA